MASKSQIRAIAKYDKKHTTGIYLKLNKTTDADILEYLQGCSNKQGVIKEAIREYLRALY